VPEGLARSLRHEVGDFLQKVYSSVAVLQARLPQDSKLERDVLARLKSGAEGCKRLIDAVQDFLSPLTLDCEVVDLADLANRLVSQRRSRHSNLEILAEAAGPAPVFADPARVGQVGELLLANACEAARQRVSFQTVLNPAAGEAEWVVTDDGAGVPAELVDRLFSPFFSTRAGHVGLGLALARKLVLLHGGRIRAGNLPEGGFRAGVVLPVGGPGNDLGSAG
jgi:signal transduction histidine kinase